MLALKNMTQDAQIMLLYKQGHTIIDIAALFKLTKQAIHQLLKRRGLTRKDNPVTRNKKLYAFIGANVTQQVKDLAVRAAARKGMSLSAWVSRTLQDELSHNMGEEE